MDKIFILNKLKEWKGFSTHGQLAKFLDVPPQNVNNWYARNTFDLEVLIKKFPEINPYWLVTGEGEMFNRKSIYFNNGRSNIQTVGNENNINQNDDFILIAKKSLENQEKTLAILNTLVTSIIEKK